MHLIPDAAWWMAAWCLNGDHHTVRPGETLALISVDICTPPALIDGEWTYTDLELDPLAFSDGRVVIDDEDEFDAACEAGRISRDEAINARAAADKVERDLRDRTEPFGRLGWDKLDEALSLSLPPIRVLP